MQFDKAKELYKKTLEIHRAHSERASLEEAADKRLMALICEAKGDYESALEHLVLASMAMVANGQDNEVASIDVSIGNIYMSLCRFDEAIFSYQKLRESKSYCENALRIYSKPVPGTTAEEIAGGLTEVSVVFESVDEPEEALKLLGRAMKLLEDKPGQQSSNALIDFSDPPGLEGLAHFLGFSLFGRAPRLKTPPKPVEDFSDEGSSDIGSNTPGGGTCKNTSMPKLVRGVTKNWRERFRESKGHSQYGSLDQIGSDGGDGSRPKRGTTINRAQSHANSSCLCSKAESSQADNELVFVFNKQGAFRTSLTFLNMSNTSSSSFSSDFSEAETSGSNSVRSLSSNAVRSPEDVEGLAEVLERNVGGERHNVETEVEPKAEGGTEARVSGRAGAEDGSDTDMAAKHKRLARKREFDLVLMSGYEWVHGEIGANYSCFRDDDSILNLLSYTKFLDGFPSEERYPIGLSRCRGDESPHPDFVFLDKSNFVVPSFYVYDCWFRDLHLKLPFDDFILSVLWALNVVSTQLHPNSWAAMQAFKANQGSDPSKLPRPTLQDIIPPVTERKRKKKGTKKAAVRAGKCSTEDEAHATISAYPEKRMNQTLIRDHTHTSLDGIPETLAGPGFINPKVSVQDFICLDFMSTEGQRAVEGLSSAEKLKALGEMYFRCAALSQVLALEPSPELSALQAKLNESERVTGEILAGNNELIEDNKKFSADNAALCHRVEELTAINNKLVEGRQKAIMELGKLDKEFKDYKMWAQAEAAHHHEHGFYHAIRQAKHFCDLRGHEFDIGMDFCKREYMSYDDMPEDANPDEDVESLFAETVPQVGDAVADGDTQADDTHAEDEQYIDIEGEEEVAPTRGVAEAPRLKTPPKSAEDFSDEGSSDVDSNTPGGGTYKNTLMPKLVRGSGRERSGRDCLRSTDACEQRSHQILVTYLSGHLPRPSTQANKAQLYINKSYRVHQQDPLEASAAILNESRLTSLPKHTLA
ncbi:hypothetical protein Fmac_026410 [Flemingia macrophylla]|uniref:Uncharacterized protein n=1 Tax=Flemingia macrophylla TaxID=520843 RepID=A0ABD1LES6_9FABA